MIAWSKKILDKVLFIKDDSKEPKEWDYINLSDEKAFKRYYKHHEFKHQSLYAKTKKWFGVDLPDPNEIFKTKGEKEYTYASAEL